MTRLKDALPDFSTVFAVAPSEPGQKRDISLQPEEWNVLALVDGRRDINDIVAASSLESVETLKHLASLQLAGLIRPAESRTPEGETLDNMVDHLCRLIEDYLVDKAGRSAGHPKNASQN